MTTSTPERDDLSTALRRRTRRASAVHDATSRASASPALDAMAPHRKRVRFSVSPSRQPASASSGLTPMIRRTGLETPPSSKRRRYSAPSESDGATSENPSPPPSPSPLRQVLDGRVQRRVRRSGLSEELNRVSRERLSNKQRLADEVERLRKDVKARDDEIYQLRNATIVADMDRIWGLEAQVETLTRQLAAERKQPSKSAPTRNTPTTTVPTTTAPTRTAPAVAPVPMSSPASLKSGNTRVTEWITPARSPLAMAYGADDDMDDGEETPTEVNTDDEGNEFGKDSLMELLGDTPRPPVCRMIVWPTPSPSRSHSASQVAPQTTSQSASGSGSGSGSRLLTPSCARTLPSATTTTTTTTRPAPNSPTPNSRVLRSRSPMAPHNTLVPPGTATTSTTTANAGCQTSFTDGDRQDTRQELNSLQLELARLSSTLESYSSLSGRLASRISRALTPVEGATPTPADGGRAASNNVEQQLDSLLRLLTDRTAAIAHLTSAIAELGFPGKDASEMIMSLSSGFRAARIELEYLTPGEVALPLTSHGAEVLDLLLCRLRDLGRRTKEDETSLDEYRALKVSLGQQLTMRTDAMAALDKELVRAQVLLGEKSFRIQELENSVATLKGAVDGYVGDVSQLDSHVRLIEGAARNAHFELSMQLSQKEEKLQALEVQLATAREAASGLDGQTTAAAIQRKGLVAEKDNRIQQLMGELEKLSSTVKQLRRENSTLRSIAQQRQPLSNATNQNQNQNQNHLLTPKMDSTSFDPNETEVEDMDTDGEVHGSPTPVVRTKPRSFSWRRSQHTPRPDSGLGLSGYSDLL